MATFSIRVVNTAEKPLKGVGVRIEFVGGGEAKSVSGATNAAGIAVFKGHKEADIDVYVNKKYYGSFRYEDKRRITAEI